MAKVKQRYGHKKGLTALYVDYKSSSFLTCGNDMNLRTWGSIDDDETKDVSIEEQQTCIVSHGNKIYIGSAVSGMVKVIDRDAGQPEPGCLTRFSLPVTHLAISYDGETLFVSSSEVGVIRKVDINTQRFQTFGYEHDAPIISLALDPRERYLASASGDGSVRIWNIFDTDCVHTIPKILMKISDISADRPLARLCWEPKDGQFLAIPVRDGVQLYERENGWKLCKTFLPRGTTTTTTTTTSTAKPPGSESAPPVANEKEQAEGKQQQLWFSVCTFSHCGKYIAAGTSNGIICVWNATTGQLRARKGFPKKAHICAVGWDPVKENEVIFCDITGEIGALRELSLEGPISGEATASTSVGGGGRKFAKVTIEDDDDDDENDEQKPDAKDGQPNVKKKPVENKQPAAVQSKQKHRRSTAVLSDDEEPELEGEGLDIGALKRFYNSQIGLDEFGNTVERPATSASHATDGAESDFAVDQGHMESGPMALRAAPSWRLTAPQPPFIVGSMPVEAEDRCMKWNAVGLLKHYNKEGDNTVEIQYHDVSVHHQISFNNSGPKFTMGDITQEAAAFASGGQLQTDKSDKSQLRVMFLRAWDTGSKEWTMDMPENEFIQCLCLGAEWVAVATDQRNIRIFTIAGVQRFLFTLPGPIVTMCGHMSRLAVVYHDGIGVDGDQCLSFAVHRVQLNNLKSSDLKTQPEVHGRLAISPKSTLTWLGFLPSYALVAADSNGIVRVLNRAVQSTWIQIGDVNTVTKSKSEHAWIVSVCEKPSRQIRYILCKGDAKYPSFNRGKPILSVMDWTLSMCDPINEKRSFESTLILNDFDKGYNDMFDDGDLKKLETETLVKLFAISCKTDRDCRSLEIARLMPTSEGMRTLIRHAVSQKRHVLAQKIGEMALQKEQEMEMDTYNPGPAVAGARPTSGSEQYAVDELEEERLFQLAQGNVDEPKKSDVPKIKLKKRSAKERERLLDDFGKESGTVVGSKALVRENGNTVSTAKDEEPRPAGAQSSGQWVNPFKKTRPPTPPRKLPPGASIFDDPSFAFNDGTKKRGPESADAFGNGEPKMDSKKAKLDVKKKQVTLESYAAAGGKRQSDGKETAKDTVVVSEQIDGTAIKPKQKMTGFMLYMQENEDYLLVTMPDDDNQDNALARHAAKCFRQLSEEVRQLFKKRADEMNNLAAEQPEAATVTVRIE